MVTQIITSTINSKINNEYLYNKFTQITSSGKTYYLKSDFPTPDSTGSISTTPTKNNGKKPRRKLIVAVGSSALAVGLGVLFVMRGLPKNVGNKLERLKKYFEVKLENSKLNGIKSLDEFYIYSIRKLNSFIDKTQSINNATSLKDILFKKLMDKTKFTSKIHKSVSDYFEKLSYKTILKSYKSTKNKFNIMYKKFDELDNLILKTNPQEIYMYKGKQYTKQELIEKAIGIRNHVKNSVDTFISPNEMNTRYNYIKNTTSTLYEKFWDESFKDFWSKNNKFKRKEMWETFIPDEIISGDKKALSKDVAEVRNKISYTNTDKQNIIQEHIKTLENLVAPNDKEGFKIIKKLEWFIKNPDGINTSREAFLKELKLLTDRPFQDGLSEAVKKNQQQLRQTHINAITELAEKQSNGDLQDMLSIYETLAPYELSSVKTSVTNAVKSFDKSLNLETVEFFDKIRDLQLGSAPTDVLSILASAGMIAYGLGKAENKDERISVILRSGIPIVGAIGTSLLCTARLISGGKSLLIGAVSGFILNRIGEYADTLRNKNNKNHTNN